MNFVTWNGESVPFRRFSNDDPTMLGEMLELGALVLHSKRAGRVAVYDCRDARILVASGGSPFAIRAYELRSDGQGKPLPELPEITDTHMQPLYAVENTGDGLTFTFDTGSYYAVTTLVVDALKDCAVKNHHDL